MSIDSALKRDCEVAVSENATTTKESLEVGNAAKLREVVKCLMDNLNIHLMQPSELITVNRAELEGMVMVCEKALAAPSRNCDMYGGDFKMLHTAWFDWTGSPSGHNADGTVKLTFAEYLLATTKKGSTV